MSHRVLILLPVFEPNLEYLQAQVSSLAAQTFTEFECLVSYDGPVSDITIFEIRKLLPDSRFQLLTRKSRLGLYRHVEALFQIAQAKSDISFIALCDQDDVWHSHRLTSQISALSESSHALVTDNAILIDASGEPYRSRTLFKHLGVDEKGIPLALLCNLVTGAGTLLRADLLGSALPFPKNAQGVVHDHWLYVVALAKGGVLLSDETTWGYRQHKQNLIGALAGSSKLSRVNPAFAKLGLILRVATTKAEDPVISHAREFEQALVKRGLDLPMYVFRPDDRISPRRALLFLHPKMLRASRLESLRLLMNGLKGVRRRTNFA